MKEPRLNIRKLLSGTLLSLAVLNFSVTLPGCRTVGNEDAASNVEGSDREVIVEENEAELEGEVSPPGAEDLRLKNKYERALGLYEEGKARAAGVVMVSARSEAEKTGAELPEGFEEDFHRIVNAEAEEDAREDDMAREPREEDVLEEFESDLRQIVEADTEPEPGIDPEDAGEIEEHLPDPDTDETDGASVVGEIQDGEEVEQLELDADYEQPEFDLPRLLDPELADEEIILDFNRVDIRVVLETISDITGTNFLIDEAVTGEVTLISSREVKLSEVFATLESILEVYGWAAVPSENLIKILPKGEGVRRHIPTRVGTDPGEIPRNDSIATQVMRLEHINVEEVVPLIEPRMTSEGNLTAHEATNTVFLTDISSNIRQIALLLRQVDIEREKEQLAIFPLQYASARSMADKMNQIIDFGDNEDVRWQTEINILPDSRTNSIIVFARQQIIQSVKEVIERLDIPRPEESVNVHVVKLENADAEEIVESLSPTIDALTDYDDADPVHITADVQTNAIIIAASPQDFQVINTVVQDLDVVREQVLVELRIMEATELAFKEIGFDWATMDAPSPDSVRGMGGTFLGPRGDLGISGERLVFDGDGMVASLVKGERVGAMMQALERSRHVNVLSTPQLLTSNHQEASISVVENVPYVRESRTVFEEDRDVIETYDYRDVGIQLDITPHIGAGGMVRMLINSEFSKIVEEGDGRIRTSERSAETTVGVESGETVVIGGLIQDDEVTLTRQVPLLGSIPVLGHLFRYESEDVEKTNLMIFITPHVMSDAKELAEMTRQKKEEQDK